MCRWIIRSRAGRLFVAIRDSEQRVLFSGYSPADYKLFVFVVSAALAGLAGALYVAQVGIITPSQIGVLPSLEMVVWVAVAGRRTLIGAVVGSRSQLGAVYSLIIFPICGRSFSAGCLWRWCSYSLKAWSTCSRNSAERGTD